MTEDVNEEYDKNMQELMLELFIKTDKLLKKLKKEAKKTKIEFWICMELNLKLFKT